MWREFCSEAVPKLAPILCQPFQQDLGFLTLTNVVLKNKRVYRRIFRESPGGRKAHQEGRLSAEYEAWAQWGDHGPRKKEAGRTLSSVYR